MNDDLLKKSLDAWKNAWKSSNRGLVFSRAIDDAIFEKTNVSAVELKTFIGFLSTKRENDLSETQKDAIKFYNRCLGTQEMVLQEGLMSGIPGQIFLAKAKFGYRDTQSIEISGESLDDVLDKKKNDKS